MGGEPLGEECRDDGPQAIGDDHHRLGAGFASMVAKIAPATLCRCWRADARGKAETMPRTTLKVKGGTPMTLKRRRQMVEPVLPPAAIIPRSGLHAEGALRTACACAPVSATWTDGWTRHRLALPGPVPAILLNVAGSPFATPDSGLSRWVDTMVIGITAPSLSRAEPSLRVAGLHPV